MNAARRWLISTVLASAFAWASAQAQQLAFTPYHANGIYAVGERIGWSVAIAPGQSAAPGAYHYVVKRDGQTIVGSGSFDPASGSAKIETMLHQPGMALVEVRPPTPDSTFRGASKSEVGRVLLGAAVAPRRIRPAGPRPRDFDAFWASEIRRLDSVPVDPVLTPGESGRPGVEYFTIRMNNVDGAHVYGQLAKPEGAGPFPALLIYQYASPPYPLQKTWVTDRAAEGWLALNVEPHDVPSDMPQAFYDALPQVIKHYNTINQGSRADNYFLGMYLGDYRASEYITSRADWNGRTLVVTGISMGSQQSFAVAGLNPRVTGLVVYVPAGSDVLGPLHGRAQGYPFWDLKRPEVRRTAPYFDPSNFAPRTKARALVAMGFVDELCPPTEAWATFNLLRGRKEALPLVDSPHNHLATSAEAAPWWKRSAEWLQALAHDSTP
jgi:cephalosporin-C deacetylase